LALQQQYRQQQQRHAAAAASSSWADTEQAPDFVVMVWTGRQRQDRGDPNSVMPAGTRSGCLRQGGKC